MRKKAIIIDPQDTYDEILTLRKTGKEGKSIELTIPRHIIRRYAKRFGIPVEKIPQAMRARIHYNNFARDGIFVEFIRG